MRLKSSIGLKRNIGRWRVEQNERPNFGWCRADFIARDDPYRAVTFVRELREACFALGDFPNAYPRVPRYGATIRRRVYGSYLIFYFVGHDIVTVLRILHGARDHDEILFPD